MLLLAIKGYLKYFIIDYFKLFNLMLFSKFQATFDYSHFLLINALANINVIL